MNYYNLLILLAHFALTSMPLNIYTNKNDHLTPSSTWIDGAACPVKGCGTADACVLTEYCTTATFTLPASTTITTCVPTATCMGVYCKNTAQSRDNHMFYHSNCSLASCEFGDPTKQCCSGYCAANKCRSTDEHWPSCNEDNGPCVVDGNCCYGNKCTGGICRRS
jgi:hypothetical protein